MQPYPTPYDPNSGLAPERSGAGFVENFGSGTGPYPGTTYHTNLIIEEFANYEEDGVTPMTRTDYSYNPHTTTDGLDDPVNEDWLSVP